MLGEYEVYIFAGAGNIRKEAQKSARGRTSYPLRPGASAPHFSLDLGPDLLHDGAEAENFFGALKAEGLHRAHFAARAEAEPLATEYIDFHNFERVPLKNGSSRKVEGKGETIQQSGMANEREGAVVIPTTISDSPGNLDFVIEAPSLPLLIGKAGKAAWATRPTGRGD